MIKLITFDLDDTLWPIHDVIRKANKKQMEWFKEHCPELLTQDFMAIRTELVERHPKQAGDLTWLRKAASKQAALNVGLSEERAGEIAEESFAVMLKERNKVTLFEGALDCLESLSKFYKLIALSNGNADLNTIGIRHLFTEHFKAQGDIPAKPDPTMFNLALEHAGVSASEAVHIGDDLTCDIEAAKALGFKTIYSDLLNRQDAKSTEAADLTLTDFKELDDLISQFQLPHGI